MGCTQSGPRSRISNPSGGKPKNKGRKKKSTEENCHPDVRHPKLGRAPPVKGSPASKSTPFPSPCTVYQPPARGGGVPDGDQTRTKISTVKKIAHKISPPPRSLLPRTNRLVGHSLSNGVLGGATRTLRRALRNGSATNTTSGLRSGCVGGKKLVRLQP